MWEYSAIPRADWLSWTMRDMPWVDFEWLSEAVFGAAYAMGGFAGLWALKVALFGLAAWRVHAWMRLYGLSAELRLAGLSAWSAAMLPRSDLRPELFSVILFAELFRRLEAVRLGGAAPSSLSMAASFALWANLHAGFGYGLALLSAYALAAAPARLLPAALAGTLLQPAGWRVYGILLAHGAQGGLLSRWIAEWGPPAVSNPWRWAELGMLAFAAAAWASAARKGRAPALIQAFALAALALAGLRHARLAVYFVTAASPLALSWLVGSPRLASGRPPLTPCAGPPGSPRLAFLYGLMAACGIWGGACGWDAGLFRRFFNDRFVPSRAAAFLEQEQAALGARALYNPWGWGGYLGWALPAPYRVFQDGRYLFHPLLLESAKAASSPDAWQAFLGQKGVELALLENIPWMLPSTRVYPDGTERSIPRPYYASYMPRDRWALVHFDEKALLFARRDALPKAWIVTREFRYARPYDEVALEDALQRREVPAAAVERERRRAALD